MEEKLILRKIGLTRKDIKSYESLKSHIESFERKIHARFKGRDIKLEQIDEIENETIREIFKKLYKKYHKTNRLRLKFLWKKIKEEGVFSITRRNLDISSHFNRKSGQPKIGYLFKNDAQKRLVQISKQDLSKKLNIYTCCYCGDYHIGNQED